MMKAVTIVAIMLVMAGSVFAQAGVQGSLMVTPFAGYSLGFGDSFKDFESVGFKATFKAGLGFGGQALYGFSDKMMMGGEIGFQQYKAEATYSNGAFSKTYNSLGAQNLDTSNTETKLIFMGVIAYQIAMLQAANIYFLAGVGFYDIGETKIGASAGLMYRRLIATSMALVIGSRFHWVNASNSFMMLQVFVGLSWMFALGAGV